MNDKILFFIASTVIILGMLLLVGLVAVAMSFFIV